MNLRSHISWLTQIILLLGILSSVVQGARPPSAQDQNDAGIQQAQAACASTWWQFFNSSMSYRTIFEKAGPTGITIDHIPETLTRKSVIRDSVIYTECDGIPRIRYTARSTITTTYTTIWSPTRSLYMENPRLRFTEPSCALRGSFCEHNWRRVVGNRTDQLDDGGNSVYASFSHGAMRPWDGEQQPLFGCDPPPDLCTRAFGKCKFAVGSFAIIYFAPRVKKADICANGGHGSYELEDDEGAKPRILVKSAVTITEVQREGEMEVVMTGPWTFTSPNVYLAYRNAGTEQLCTGYQEQTRTHGIIQVPQSQLKKIISRDINFNGSDLQYVQALARHGDIDIDAFQVTTELPLTLPSLMSPIPAADYFMNLAGCDQVQGKCTAIVEADYRPYIKIPEVFSSLNPTWKSCDWPAPVWDPSLVFGLNDVGEELPSVPGSPAPQITKASEAGRLLNPAAPGATIAAFSTPTAAAISGGRGTGSQGPSTKPGIFAWQGAPPLSTDGAIRLAPILGSPGSFALAGNILSVGGPAYSMSGKLVSLASGSLIVGTKVLAIETGAPVDGATMATPVPAIVPLDMLEGGRQANLGYGSGYGDGGAGASAVANGNADSIGSPRNNGSGGGANDISPSGASPALDAAGELLASQGSVITMSRQVTFTSQSGSSRLATAVGQAVSTTKKKSGAARRFGVLWFRR